MADKTTDDNLAELIGDNVPIHLAGRHYFLVPKARAEAAEKALLEARAQGLSAKKQLAALKAAAFPKASEGKR